MKNNWRFLGFDLGAESRRCMVASLSDDKLTLNEVYRFSTHNIKNETGFHWDIHAINSEILQGLTKAVKEFGADYDGISVDTWGVDYVLLNQDNSIADLPYHYRDDRTDGMIDEAFKLVKRENIYCRTGIQFAQYNTLFQLLAEKKENLNLLKRADKMLLMPDYINFTLSGKIVSEYSIASTTNLIDPLTRNWAWDLIDAFELPRHIFPRVVEPGTKLGPIDPSVAKLTGINPNVPIFACTGHDTASAVVSIPYTQNNWAFLSSGTWSLMGVELDKPILDENALKYNFTNEGGYNNTIRFLKNIIGLWPVQECRRAWSQEGKNYSYAELEILTREEGLTGAWVDLNSSEFLKPGNMPEKVVDYLKNSGQKFKTNPGFIIGVILESLGFCYRRTIKQIEEVTQKPVDVLHAVGGGIQNTLLNQYTTDAINRKVVTGPVEGAIIGNVGVQAIASGVIPDRKHWRKIVANSFEVKEYEPVNTKYFDQNEEQFLRVTIQKKI
ncbi:MAG: rhamnulokinase family protein [Bacteroidota bacterium]|nr:rhamnulokinase family protein [Bacteroidota bacterium]